MIGALPGGKTSFLRIFKQILSDCRTIGKIIPIVFRSSISNIAWEHVASEVLNSSGIRSLCF